MKGRGSDRAARANERRTSVLAIALLVSIAAAMGGIGAGIAGAQTGSGPTPVDSCTTITESGEYVLTTNVTNRTADACIAITASDVVFDGGGHTIVGDKPHYGIRVDNGETAQSNVTVRNVRVDGWVRGIAFMNDSSGVVERTIATDNIEGYLVQESSDVTVRNNYAHDNALGIHVRNAEGNLVTRNVANDNKWGIHLEFRARNNRIVDNVARNNSNQDLMSRQDSTANVISRLDVGSGTFSFVTTNVALKGTDSAPSGPGGQGGVNSSITAIAATTEELEPALDSLTVHYRDASGDVSSLSIWRGDGGSWSELDSTVGQDENVVRTTNVTEFGTFGAFGAGDVSAERVTLDVTPPTLTERSAPNATADTTATDESTATATTDESTTTDEATTTGTADTTTVGTETAEMNGSTAAASTATGANGAETAGSTATTSDVTDSEAGGGAATETSGPGFGLVVALIALLGAALLATRRR